MGSSVFHGGFSTFLCIVVLSQAKVYSIVVFFKSWIIIVGLGLLNGLVLLPVILSLVGPLQYEEPTEQAQVDDKKAAEQVIDQTKTQKWD